MDKNPSIVFSWSIRNYSFYLGNEIPSPLFPVEFLEDASGQVELHAKGADDEGRMPGFSSCYLTMEDETDQDFFCELAVYKSGGVFDRKEKFSFATSTGFVNFMSVHQLKEYSALNGDTLIIRCELWPKDENSLEVPVIYAAIYEISVLRFTYTWALHDFANLFEKKLNEAEDQDLKIHCFSTEISYFRMNILNDNNDNVCFLIKDWCEKLKLFLRCAIHVLDANGNKKLSVEREGLSEIPSEGSSTGLDDNVELNIPYQTLLSDTKLYLPDGKLTLLCEFSISSDQYEVKKIKFGDKEDFRLKYFTSNLVSEEQAYVAEREEKLWKADMKKIYLEGNFSDFVVKTRNRQFPVHKAFLGAHSEVFRAMLELDMKEKNSGVVEIEDLEEDTVSKMVMFLYTGTVEGTDCSTSLKLYSAADKYGINVLKEICSKYLMAHVDVSNVCDILKIADAHCDTELKQVASDFVVKHAFDVIKSDNWEKIMESNGHLTSVIMKQFICQRLEGN